MRQTLLLICLSVLFAACSHGGPNSDETRYRVLVRDVEDYFGPSADSVTRRAASFLLGPVMEQYHYAGETIDAFDELFVWLDSLHRDEPWNDEALLEEKFNALSGMYGMPDELSANKVPDVRMLTSQLKLRKIFQLTY